MSQVTNAKKQLKLFVSFESIASLVEDRMRESHVTDFLFGITINVLSTSRKQLSDGRKHTSRRDEVKRMDMLGKLQLRM